MGDRRGGADRSDVPLGIGLPRPSRRPRTRGPGPLIRADPFPYSGRTRSESGRIVVGQSSLDLAVDLLAALLLHAPGNHEIDEPRPDDRDDEPDRDRGQIDLGLPGTGERDQQDVRDDGSEPDPDDPLHRSSHCLACRLAQPWREPAASTHDGQWSGAISPDIALISPSGPHQADRICWPARIAANCRVPVSSNQRPGKEEPRVVGPGVQGRCGLGCGERIRTSDLRVMSPTSCRCSTPRPVTLGPRVDSVKHVVQRPIRVPSSHAPRSRAARSRPVDRVPRAAAGSPAPVGRAVVTHDRVICLDPVDPRVRARRPACRNALPHPDPDRGLDRAVHRGPGSPDQDRPTGPWRDARSSPRGPTADQERHATGPARWTGRPSGLARVLESGRHPVDRELDEPQDALAFRIVGWQRTQPGKQADLQFGQRVDVRVTQRHGPLQDG